LIEEEDKCCDMNVMKTVLRCSPSDAKVSIEVYNSVVCEGISTSSM